jgi:hypothetical protein
MPGDCALKRTKNCWCDGVWDGDLKCPWDRRRIGRLFMDGRGAFVTRARQSATLWSEFLDLELGVHM